MLPLQATLSRLRPSTRARRLAATLAAPEQIKKVVSKAVLVDLRTPEEISANPGPKGALRWDVRNGSARPTLPADKETPVILF